MLLVIEHVRQVAGVDHVGIGSDFDGTDQVPDGLEDVSCYPRLTEELLNRGYSEDDIHKILGGNALRAFRKAGEVATTHAGNGLAGLAERADALGGRLVAGPVDGSATGFRLRVEVPA